MQFFIYACEGFGCFFKKYFYIVVLVCLLVVFAYLIHSVRDRNYMHFFLGSVFWVFPFFLSLSRFFGDGGGV